jgi:DNA-binding NarL/FixJ family response regulator
MTRPTVLLADDHPLVCTGLKTLLEPAYEVVAMVHDGNDVLGTVARYEPDLVLMDLSLPGQNGLTLTRQLKQENPARKVIVVSMHADRAYVDEAMRAGADGYLLKTARAPELRHALAEVLGGRHYVSPDLRAARPSPPTEVAAGGLVPGGELAGVSELTERQKQVLLLIGQGLSTQEIASLLGVTAKAIEYHRSGIRQALAITTQAGLYRIATRFAEATEAGHGP